MRFWNGDPRAGGQLIGSAPPLAQLLPECTAPKKGTFLWTPTQSGSYTIFAELTAANSNLERNGNNNYASVTLLVSDNATTPLPTATATRTLFPTPTPTPMPTPTVTRTPLPSATVTLRPRRPQRRNRR